MTGRMADKWKRVRLGDAATFVNGMAFKPTDWDTTGLPIIRIQNLTEGRSEIHYFSGSCPEKYLVNQGDVLISWSATLGVYIWNNEKAVLNQHIFKVVFDKLEFDKRYFVYIVGQKINEMSQNTHGSTMKHIIKKYFDAIEIPLPPLDEQKRIADVLDKASELIKKRKEQIRLMDQLAKSLFIEMFGDPVENPMGWDVKPLRQVTTKIGDGLHGTPEFDDDGQYFFINGNNLEKGKIVITNSTNRVSYTEYVKYKIDLTERSLLVSINGTLGKTAFYANENVILGKSACYCNLSDEINNCFAYSIIHSEYFVNYAMKASTASTIRNVSLHSMREFPVPLPPLSLQNEFADRIDAIEQQKALLQDGLAKMETAYKALMQEYFG